MDKLRRISIRVQEFGRGQTMTECALILAATAIVAFIGYQTMGTDINNLLSTMDAQL